MDITFDEMVAQVTEWLYAAPPELQTEFLTTKKEKLIAYHNTVGRDIRNEFQLWNRPWTKQLDDQGVDMSEDHPDHISMRVLETVWDNLHCKGY